MEWDFERRAYAPKSRLATLQSFALCARVKGIDHVTVMNWVKQVGALLPNAYDPETNPQVGELDELETFVGSKKTRFGAAAIAASDARRVFELCSCDSGSSFSTRYSRVGFRRS